MVAAAPIVAKDDRAPAARGTVTSGALLAALPFRQVTDE